MYVFACFYAIRCVPYLVIILKQGFVVWGVGGFLSLFFNLFWTTDLFENLKIAVDGILPLPKNACTHTFAHHSRFLDSLQISESQVKNVCPAAFGALDKLKCFSI